MIFPRASRQEVLSSTLLAALAAVVLTGAACGRSNGGPAASTPAAGSGAAASATSANASIPTVSVSAREYAYDAPENIPAGLTRIRMQNAGKEDHQAQLLKLKSGVTLDQFQAALQKGPGAALSMSTAEGGPNADKPGDTSDSVQNLQPGSYVFICFVPAADGVPHFAKGMIKAVQVTAASTVATPAQFPPAPTTVTARDFLFDGVSTTLPAGQATISFKNAGTQGHEMSLIKLNSGVSPDQLKAAFASGTPAAGPPPFSSEGGMGGISPGETGQTTVNLTPGTYAFVCNIPDPTSGKPHVALGMFSSFTVR